MSVAGAAPGPTGASAAGGAGELRLLIGDAYRGPLVVPKTEEIEPAGSVSTTHVAGSQGEKALRSALYDRTGRQHPQNGRRHRKSSRGIRRDADEKGFGVIRGNT